MPSVSKYPGLSIIKILLKQPISASLFIAYPPMIVHHLEERIAGLKKAMNLFIEDNQQKEELINIDNVSCTFAIAKQQILDHLKTFNGINVLDFFVVRRSLLTSLLAHFATFFIVLLQFRVSEHSSNPKIVTFSHNDTSL